MSTAPTRWGVPLASLSIVAAVWIALQLAGSGSPGESGPAQAATAAPLSAVPGFRTDAWYLPDDSLLGFVEIPAGAFVMGSDPALDPLAYDVERWSAGEPRGTVELPTFYMGRFEVTVAQYDAFVRASGHRVADRAALAGAPSDPVANVAWTDAVAYARWLDRALRDGPGTPEPLARLLSDGWSVTLPTEAEWEKAARGSDGRIWPWGDEPLREVANFGSRGVVAVGFHACLECPFGLADMAGNVWEWTRSPYQPYPYADADDREGLGAEALWVMRGGSFADGERNVRAASRGGADPGARRPFIGFRVALTRR